MQSVSTSNTSNENEKTSPALKSSYELKIAPLILPNASGAAYKTDMHYKLITLNFFTRRTFLLIMWDMPKPVRTPCIV
jgi:hypothetical protein